MVSPCIVVRSYSDREWYCSVSRQVLLGKILLYNRPITDTTPYVVTQKTHNVLIFLKILDNTKKNSSSLEFQHS